MKRIAAFTTLAVILLIVTVSSEGVSPYTMPNPGDFLDVSGRTEVDCGTATQGKTMVALVFGQSNSANHSETPHKPEKNAYSFFNGRCYVAADPLPGTTGNRGSVWTRLGDRIIERGMYDNVVFVSIGVGGTNIERWTTRGDLHRRFKDVSKQLKKKDIRITHMFWHQGESDKSRGTTRADYKEMFMDMLKGIRKLGIEAPIYVSVATRCGGGAPGYEIQQAQRELVDTRRGIFPGPDTDQLDSLDDRFDACHFSNSGLDKFAELWFNAITLSEK